MAACSAFGKLAKNSGYLAARHVDQVGKGLLTQSRRLPKTPGLRTESQELGLDPVVHRHDVLPAPSGELSLPALVLVGLLLALQHYTDIVERPMA